MAVISALIIVRARIGSDEGARARGGVVAKALSEGGLRYATQLWRNGDPRVDDGEFSCQTDTGFLHLTVTPAGARLDINLATEPVLEALFVYLGAEQGEARNAAALIADYRDTDSTPRAHGGEEQAYRAAGLPYGPKNDLFGTVAELAHIPGIPGWLYREAYPHITVRGTLKPDVSYADPVVLSVIQATTDLAPSQASGGIRRDSRMSNVTAQPPSRLANRSAPLRVRSAARGRTGGFYVLDAEIVGSVSRQTVPFIARLDIGSVEPGEFEGYEAADLPECSLGR